MVLLSLLFVLSLCYLRFGLWELLGICQIYHFAAIISFIRGGLVSVCIGLFCLLLEVFLLRLWTSLLLSCKMRQFYLWNPYLKKALNGSPQLKISISISEMQSFKVMIKKKRISLFFHIKHLTNFVNNTFYSLSIVGNKNERN